MKYAVKGKSGILGVIFLLAVPVWIFFVKPLLLRLPEDFSFAADVVSVDTFFDETRGSYAGPVYSKTQFTYGSVKTDGDVSSIRNVFDVRTPEGEPIFSDPVSMGSTERRGSMCRDMATGNVRGIFLLRET